MDNSNALTIIAPKTVEEAKRFADLASQSQLLPTTLRGKPADVFAILLTGMELGLGPMQAVRAIHIIQGRPVMSAELLVALAKNNKKCKYFQLVESTAERATYRTQREGDPEPTTITYTIAEAKAAGLTSKDNWKNHAAAMLRARAGSALARAVYPDSIMGIYSREEMVRDAVEDAIDVEAEPVKEPLAVPFTEDGPREVEFPMGEASNGKEVDVYAEKKKNAKDFHELVNSILPGDRNKVARKKAYLEVFGLGKEKNVIVEFLDKTLDEQKWLLEHATKWVEAEQNKALEASQGEVPF